MAKVIAAIDNSPTAATVLRVARVLAPLWGADVSAAHVRENGARAAAASADAAGLPIEFLAPPVVQALASRARDEDVAMVVVGTRGIPTRWTAVGRTAERLVDELDKPVAAVPPDVPPRWTLGRVLIPVAGSPGMASGLAGEMERIRRAGIDVTVLHVIEVGDLPLFSNHAHHDSEAWRAEFVERFCPEGSRDVAVHERVGRPAGTIVAAAAELRADLIILTWGGRLARGRAPVVRKTLEATMIPVLLVQTQPEVIDLTGSEERADEDAGPSPLRAHSQPR